MTGLTDDMTAVVFDFYGTLTPVTPSAAWAANAARLASVMGAESPALVRVLDETFPERVSGAFGGVRETMRAVAERLGIALSDEQLDAASRARRDIQESMFALRPEALDVIRRLRRDGLRIGLVSDCTAELPDAWERLPLAELVDAAVFSCIERTRKPDARMFRAVAERLPADPARCLYIGDGGSRELSGARAMGMRAVLLAGRDWYQHRDHNLETDWTGPRVGSLTELV